MRFLAALALSAALYAQTGFFPLSEVRPGLVGVGRTVFSGSRIEEFTAEILGVLENVAPGQSLVLARLGGGPLDTTGVLQGMSGSPVYIDGRLLGAVAMTFAYSKEPIAAIRPIQDLLRAGEDRDVRRAQLRASPGEAELALAVAPVQSIAAGGAHLVDIATPIWFAGFGRQTLAYFSPRLRLLGLEPQQGISGGGRLEPGLGDPATLQPGAMISVQLMTGDMSVGADGTVTYIDGNRVYAFGHRFLALGATEIPFAVSEVLALLPSLQASFKISAPRRWMGAILADRSTGVAGELGRKVALVPLLISVNSRDLQGRPLRRQEYRMEMVADSVLSPLLVQMALSSAIEATERSVGNSTLALRGEIRFEGQSSPIRLGNSYAGDLSLPQLASMGAASPLAYAMQSGLGGLRLKEVVLEVDSYPERRQAQIDQVWTSRRQVRPGEEVELNVVFTTATGAEINRKITYSVPLGFEPGPLYFTVADGSTTNLTEYRHLLNTPPRSPAQLVGFLNSLRDNSRAYVRVWRPAGNYDVQGQSFPAPPPSVEQILARSQPGVGATALPRNAKMAELVIETGGLVVSGSKTVQVDVKE